MFIYIRFLSNLGLTHSSLILCLFLTVSLSFFSSTRNYSGSYLDWVQQEEARSKK